MTDILANFSDELDPSMLELPAGFPAPPRHLTAAERAEGFYWTLDNDEWFAERPLDDRPLS